MAVWGVSTWLLQDLHTVPTPQQISARIEAVRTALAAGAGVGAAVTLLLAVRRQRHQELATAHTTHDAAERRVTELYTKAAEQLGNDQAPVRLGGLYALERLAQDTPALRQTIVDVICSYLRMPYTPPREDRGEKIRAAQRAARHREPARSASGGGRDPQEERQVRLTAQRILTAHLRYDDSPASRRWWPSRHPDRNPRHWPDIQLDLTGAVLIDFNLGTCRMGTAVFEGATFTGDAWFDRATFTGTAWFDRATFTGAAWFDRATFTGAARFDRATFTGDARFGKAFTSDARFDRATFTGDARFDEATFTGDARFDRATFTGTAWFDEATFTGDAWFDEATFTGDARFDEATFTGDAWFDRATFGGGAGFGGASGLERAGLAGVRVAPAAEGVLRV
ncbi:pentapeptide repeat-containing protein, partial [Nonomuraea candida]|uniref:pentapeptide repeat-containing protein n=1 Tax=Nonomuraea candida TaxID=359159 RepID=UPI0012FB9DAC